MIRLRTHPPPSGFSRLWAAAVASNLGDGMVIAAFPLLAARMTEDPIAISAITAAAGLPWLIVGPFAGALVDRQDRRRLMIAFDTIRAVILGAFTVMVLAGIESIWAIYFVVGAIAAGETIVDTASQSLLPALVPRDRLAWANGRLFSTMTVAHRFVGPPLGGFLFGIAALAPMGLDAVSFGTAAFLIWTIPGRFRPQTTTAGKVNIMASVLEGMTWLWGHRPIRAFAIGAAMLNIGTLAGEAILVLYATEQLGLDGVGFGALFAATAVGYTLGSGISPRVTARFDRRTVIGLSVTSISVALVVIGTALHWLTAAVGLMVIGVATGLWDVVAVSFRQAVVPDRLLGRIMAAYRVIAYGSFPVGALLGGMVARVAGNRGAFLVGAVVVAIAIPYVLLAIRGVDLDPARATIEPNSPEC